MENEQEWQKTVKRLRATLRRRLTIAKQEPQTAEKWKLVLEQVQIGTAYFLRYGWPDWWSEFQRAEDDAVWALRGLERW